MGIPAMPKPLLSLGGDGVPFEASLKTLTMDIGAIELKNILGNQQMVAPSIQKYLANAATKEIINLIIEDLGDNLFRILVDESSDLFGKEQMTVVIRYVDKMKIIKKYFIDIVHVANTCATSLKVAIDSILLEHGLSISRIQGQGYDGASNMQGEFNDLKSLILRDNESVYYVHYFAHQLQLTIVATAKKHIDVI
ncbi:uncharacterized protein [Elaeis guineensis]|uniref:uncharacterized protein n=1 Tax=Elaeis guineensis var. tenera TaxID=51953 RepID=UPI003C6CD7CA